MLLRDAVFLGSPQSVSINIHTSAKTHKPFVFVPRQKLPTDYNTDIQVHLQLSHDTDYFEKSKMGGQETSRLTKHLHKY